MIPFPFPVLEAGRFFLLLELTKVGGTPRTGSPWSFWVSVLSTETQSLALCQLQFRFSCLALVPVAVLLPWMCWWLWLPVFASPSLLPLSLLLYPQLLQIQESCWFASVFGFLLALRTWWQLVVVQEWKNWLRDQTKNLDIHPVRNGGLTHDTGNISYRRGRMGCLIDGIGTTGQTSWKLLTWSLPSYIKI